MGHRRSRQAEAPGRSDAPTGRKFTRVATGWCPSDTIVFMPSQHGGPTVAPMADLFEEYPFGRAWDEMFSAPGEIRPAYDSVFAALQTLDAADLKARSDIMGRTFLDQGITFALGGVERPFPLDLIPRIVTAAEWRVVETGVPQRIRALEAFLADVYGQGKIFADGVVPRRLITTSPHFHRQVVGMNAQDGARVVISGVDLIRDEHGVFRVLEDNVRDPVRRFLRAGEPAGRHPGAVRGRRRPKGPAGFRISRPIAPRAARCRAVEYHRPECRGAHPRRLQLRLFRAHPAGQGNGRRAGRGTRPDLPEQPRLSPHDLQRNAGARHLPPRSTTSSWIRCSSGRTHCSVRPV